mmetsp:Transcript_40535/g.114814  ORF Transcript_40535/g.114814 Transcript_40535/m.114814 type:complete len:197 (-) Transcript_40535:228-818(-)
MSFLKEPNSVFPDAERRHFANSSGERPRAAGCTLGPGLVPSTAESDAWGHHINRTHVAHQGNAALPSNGTTHPEPVTQADPGRWQSSYQAQSTQQGYLQDDVGRPTQRRGRKALPPPGQAPTPPLSFGGFSGMGRVGEEHIHDGTSKNSSHIPGYSGHIPVADKEKAYNVSARNAHDKSLFMDNYASQMRAMGRKL